MITNKRGLSDVVTTTLIILLVVVGIAAIWAFVSPSIRGTGTQFTKTQTCISNQIDVMTCKPGTAAAGNWNKDAAIRRSLVDGNAVLQDVKVDITNIATSVVLSSSAVSVAANSVAQGGLVTITSADTANPAPGAGIAQATVTSNYKLPDNSLITCRSAPVTCE